MTESTDIILYDYWRSSASYRVRIALALANLDYQRVSINLLNNEHREADHLLRNPQGLVPVLDIDGHRLTQSLAIIEYLQQTRALTLLPDDPLKAATARALAYSLAVDVHPVCNLSVVAYATGGEEPARTQWMREFIQPALDVFEKRLAEVPREPFCFGKQPGLVELCLVPQLYNARRWGVDYSSHTALCAIESECAALPAFGKSTPEAVNS